MSERVREMRVFWERETQPKLRDQRVWFLDETGVNLAMTRTHARAWRGMRARGNAPKNDARGTTILAAMSKGGEIAALELRGATDELVMLKFIENVLSKAVKVGDVIVMDNLSSHKTGRVQAAFAGIGLEVLYLPPYSPDLNPIEMCWSKLKTVMRRIGARSYEELSEAIRAGLSAITSWDAGNWSRHCGYV